MPKQGRFKAFVSKVKDRIQDIKTKMDDPRRSDSDHLEIEDLDPQS